jgi:hypothetical protein
MDTSRVSGHKLLKVKSKIIKISFSFSFSFYSPCYIAHFKCGDHATVMQRSILALKNEKSKKQFSYNIGAEFGHFI